MNYSIHNYIIERKIGKGAYGEVYLGYKSSEEYDLLAVKKIKEEPKYKKSALKEIKLLKILRNPGNKYIINLLDDFIYKNVQYLVFEYMDINLYKFYKDYGRILLKDEYKNIILSIARGIQYMHSFNIIHGDLKPENIMINFENKDTKIIDFGSSFLEKSHYTNFYIQSRYYRAPEVIYKINIGKEIDIWSYGCIIYELYVCYPLFNAKNENLLLHKFAEKIGIPYDDLEYYNTEIFHNNFIFSSKEKTFVRKTDNIYINKIDKNYLEKRLKDVFDNNYFTHNEKRNISDLILNIIKYNHKNRIIIDDICNHEFFNNIRSKIVHF